MILLDERVGINEVGNKENEREYPMIERNACLVRERPK